jgi:predicted peptidase
MLTPRLAAYFLLLLLTNSSFSQSNLSQHPKEFVASVTREVRLKYLLFLPCSYLDGQPKRWPLILYLHGGSRRGTDLEKLREPGYGLTALVEKDKSFPFVVLSPQCDEGEFWTDTESLIALLDDVLKKYSIDPTRVYLTGHSMGGFGTWYLAYKYPDRFAAIAPMSAPFVVNAWASKLKDLPIWAFHGEKDDIVPISGIQDLITTLKSLGNTPRFTVLPNRDHYILDTYQNQELYAWFLQHSRTAK